MRVRRLLARRLLYASAIAALAWLASGCPRETAINLGTPEKVADGVQLYRVDDANLLDPPGPVAVQILRLDPSKIDLRSALAHDRVMQLETVPDIAARTNAIAAVNAGFFVVKNGDPAGVLELGDELVSDSPLTRGAVGIVRAPGKPLSLVFDRVGASLSLSYAVGGESFSQEINGVDTTRVRGQLMLYTPRFGPDSDMADTGVEWQLAGSPLARHRAAPQCGPHAHSGRRRRAVVRRHGAADGPRAPGRRAAGLHRDAFPDAPRHEARAVGRGPGHRRRRRPARASRTADDRLVHGTAARGLRHRAASRAR